MTKAAKLLLHGTQACVDGRDAHAIIGTPGGDAGELVLALAAAEQLGRRAFSAEAVERVFADYLDASGHFYLHTDFHAADRWLDGANVGIQGRGDVLAGEQLGATTRYLAPDLPVFVGTVRGGQFTVEENPTLGHSNPQQRLEGVQP